MGLNATWEHVEAWSQMKEQEASRPLQAKFTACCSHEVPTCRDCSSRGCTPNGHRSDSPSTPPHHTQVYNLRGSRGHIR